MVRLTSHVLPGHVYHPKNTLLLLVGKQPYVNDLAIINYCAMMTIINSLRYQW